MQATAGRQEIQAKAHAHQRRSRVISYYSQSSCKLPDQRPPYQEPYLAPELSRMGGTTKGRSCRSGARNKCPTAKREETASVAAPNSAEWASSVADWASWQALGLSRT